MGRILPIDVSRGSAASPSVMRVEQIASGTSNAGAGPGWVNLGNCALRPAPGQRPGRQAVERDLVVERLARQAEEARGLAAAEAVAPQRVEDPFALACEARA